MYKTKENLLILFLIFILFFSRGVLAESNFIQVQDSLQQVLDNNLVELELYGIQAALRAGDLYWQGESGFADSARETELKQNHIMRVGSVTKIFTAPLILKLAEEGEFDLDDRISDWFPKYAQAEQITIRQLLNHSSGIYNYTENLWLSLETALRPKKRWSPAEILEKTYDKEFYFKPGEGHYYSNTNYLILGLIAEKSTGKTLSALYREYIFAPFELTNTYFVPYEGIPENLITGYDRDVLPLGEHEMTAAKNAFATLGFSAGAIVSTASDLRKWIDILFGLDFLNKNSLKEMMDYLEVADPDMQNQIGYGLGLRVLKIEEQVLYGHTGTIPGFGAAVFYCPEKDYSLAVMSNISIFDQINVISDLVEIINTEK